MIAIARVHSLFIKKKQGSKCQNYKKPEGWNPGNLRNLKIPKFINNIPTHTHTTTQTLTLRNTN